MANVVIAGTASGATPLPVAVSIDGANDYLPIYTATATATQAITRNTLLGVTGTPADLSTVQTFTNKVLGVTNTVTLKDTLFTLEDDGDVTKKLQFQLSGITTGTTRTITVPDASITLVGVAATQTLTNKTLTSPIINAPTITNATITADTISGFTTSNTGSIYGISVTTGAISSALSLTSTLAVTGATTLTGALTVNNTVSTTGQLSVQTSTAPPAAGASTSGIKVSSTANLGLFWGSGAPTFSAAQGAVYMRTDGSSTSTRLYINTTGSTTWTNVTTAA
jgi:hypothetical protein